ncbi:uncharacterized protein [Salmo salar]|uniref:Uncharacterized protein n=1 Tax=Salmo salar TaxID=8030 RepID=A0ABM3F259_SALSA|nr:uncharacterized protein LOC106595406 [Salmo salar]|eukprot:XP_014042251.1 PREDICTED: uncharacterized protein LOC106595406 [Salmo salar]
MASNFIPLYILGVVLILYIVKADEYNKTGLDDNDGSDPIPTTTLTATPATPSAAQNNPTVTTLVQPDYRDSNLTNNITVGSRDGNQTQDQNQNQDQNEDVGVGTSRDDVTTVAAETTPSGATNGRSEEVQLDGTVSNDAITTSSPVLIESTGRGSSATAGYVILFLILLVIVCLVVVLYFQRKKSRKYSFDLAGNDHDTPLTCVEQAGTFEPNEKAGGFDYVIESGGDDHQAMGPVANGSAGEARSAGENGEKQGHGDSDGDSFDNFCGHAITLTPTVKRVGFSLDMSDRQSDKSDNGEQNGNNNNVAVGMTPEPPGLTFDPVGPGDVFTEISLDI